MLYTVHFTTFSLGGRFFPDTVYVQPITCLFSTFKRSLWL